MGATVARSVMLGAVLTTLALTMAVPAAVAGSPTGAARINAQAFERKLRAAKGVDLVTKVRLAAQIKRFTVDFYWFHKGKRSQTLAQLRARFDAIYRTITRLVMDRDAGLYALLTRSREALWRAFADRDRYVAGFGRKVVRRLEGRDPQLAARR